MKKLFCVLLIFITSVKCLRAQGYDIKIDLKGSADTMAYLVKYTFDQQYLADTALVSKKGRIQFKGNKPLEKGVYTLVSQSKSVYFDFFINENQKFAITTNTTDIVGNLKVSGNKENADFFSYIKFIGAKNKEFTNLKDQTKGKSKADSAAFMSQRLKQLNEEVKKFDADFMKRVKGTFLYDVMNLKTEKEPVEIPKASNGRPDSLYQYQYYKNHFFDGIDFKDDRIIRTPFFDDRIKKYFDQVILQHPDTMITEIDKLLAKTTDGSLVYNLLLGYFTTKSEQSKIMGFDKVFVHLADKYITSGRAKNLYSEETVEKVKERVNIIRNLLIGVKVPELQMIDTIDGPVVNKMGFDTVTSSQSVTEIYYRNIDKLTPMFKSLYQVKAKYTILIFWAVDCSHCQTEIPKLHEDLKAIKGKIDYKVFAVQTKDELFDTWRKFLQQKKLNDFMHVYDPVHLNNLKDRFDIYSTPVIYVLDKDKKIKAKRIGAEQVVSLLETLEKIEKQQGGSK